MQCVAREVVYAAESPSSAPDVLQYFVLLTFQSHKRVFPGAALHEGYQVGSNKGSDRSPEFRRLHPRKTIRFIVDGDSDVFQISDHMLCYLQFT